VGDKKSISKMIEGLREVALYDEFTQSKLEILAANTGEHSRIAEKERDLIEDIFSDYIERIGKDGTIRFDSLASSRPGVAQTARTFEINEFLGFGNMGPVYSVTAGGKPYALKLYSSRHLKEIISNHGKFGLGGILHDLESQEDPPRLSNLGRRVFSKRPKDVYGRCNRMVKIHDVGADPHRMFVLMDLLAVDPINKADPYQLGGQEADIVLWGIDCCVALCNLHVEEKRLHLNIRPEAFIRHAVEEKSRQPKYCFFHYPKKYYRPEGSASLTTEFIMVDHLDNSVDIHDKGPKGIATVGSWPFIPPETILQLLKILRVHYDIYVEKGRAVEETLTIKLTRTQMDDVWALGLTLYQFLTGGKNPFGEPRNLVDMVNSILLKKFDFSPIDPLFRDLISSMLEKDPKKRFLSLLAGCPDKIRSRKVLAEAILFKLEQIGLQYGPGKDSA
jgi:serine/threonine protein kinase